MPRINFRDVLDEDFNTQPGWKDLTPTIVNGPSPTAIYRDEVELMSTLPSFSSEDLDLFSRENNVTASTRLVDIAMWLKNEQSKYIGVRFQSQSGKQVYIYKCEGCEIGDLVVVPPTPYSAIPQICEVVRLGRSGDDVRRGLRNKTAVRLPKKTQQKLIDRN